MDGEVRRQAQRLLEKQGMTFKLSSKVTAVDSSGKRLKATVEPAKGGAAETIEADTVLVAIGRVPYTEGLGLNELGVKLDERGRVAVDHYYATSVPGIWAIGDVIAGPMLAHKAEDEGVAVAEILVGQAGHVNYDAIPNVVYTFPEIATVGKGEEELKAAGVAYNAGKFPFTANGRAKVNLTTDGFVKILADAKTDRVLGVQLICADAGNMRHEGPPRGRFISPRLAEAVAISLTRGEQALLFLNRRGYSPLTLCRACGFRFHCPNCDAWLVDHRFKRRLVCHHCGYSIPPPAECPNCHATESLAAVGPGVERLEQEAAELFPQARILVLSSDLVESVERLRQELDDVAEGRFDLVIGTQLVAKGHHFPKLNLVGIVDADLGLGNGDPRAPERTFQLLHQVVGRAGREAGRGFGYLQTHQPEHPVMRALISGDREAFYKNEIEQRERTGYPPFGRLAGLVITANERHGADSNRAADHSAGI